MDILKKISFYTAISVLTSIVSFLLLPIMTKYLDTDDYGTLSIFNSSIRFFIAFLSIGGINVLMVKLFEVDKKSFNDYLKSFLAIVLVNTFIFTIVIVIFIAFFGSFFDLPVWLAISLPLVGLGVLLFEGLLSITVYQKKPKDYAAIALTKFFIEISVSIYLVVAIGLNWVGRVNGLFISIAFVLLLGYRYLKKNNLLSGKFVRSKSKELIVVGFPLIFMNLAIMVMNMSDRFYIEAMEGLSETGIYSVGCVIAGIELMIITASMNVIRPLLYEKLTNYPQTKKEINKITYLYFAIIFASILGINFIAPFIFEYFIDINFNSAFAFILPLTIGLFFWGCYNYFISFLLFYKKNRHIGYTSLIAILLNLLLNYFFILEFSTMGAAYASLISYVIISIVIIFIVRYELKKLT